MKETDRERMSCTRITPRNKGHYFFGYYDNPAWSGNEQHHLCHRVSFCNRLPNHEDEAELGMIDLSKENEPNFLSLTHTTTWNFQQGAMLQWHPRYPDEQILFNDRDGEEARGVIYQIHTGNRRWLDRPIANVDAQGKYALSYHFGRLFPFRPGYGYAGVTDPHHATMRPPDDGLHLLDLQTGHSRCIFTLDCAQLAQVIAPIFPSDEDKLVINHATFNPGGTRILVLIRNIPRPGERRRTAAVTINPDGTDPFLMTTHPLTSHYHWKNEIELVVYAGRTGGEAADGGLFVWKDRTGDFLEVNADFFMQDGHCSYSPDRNWLLYDSYPDRDSHRHLYLYDVKRQQGHTLGSYYSQPEIKGDIRCDLHPRWNRSGTAISFDSMHEGYRHMYKLNVSAWTGGRDR